MKNIKIITIAILLSGILFFSCKEKTDGGGGDGSIKTTITISPVSKFEGNETTTFDFKVRLNQTTSDLVTVDFQTKDLSADAGEDYVANSGTLTFDGTTTEIITIEIVTDTLLEGDEEFEISLTNPTNAIFDKESTTGTIRNDDTFLPGGNDGYTTPDSYAGMTLVWQDEFEGTSIDGNNWMHETGDHGWGNNELQNYTTSSANSYVSDGKLIIEAKKEGNGYTSARMISAGKQEFAFGRIDIRAKLPEGQGIWPALWMLGENFWTSGWPSCGEIDIMELVGHEPGKTHGTGHFGPQGSPSTHIGNAYSLTGGEKFSEEYHVFTIIWENNQIKWYVDDNQFFTLSSSDVGGNYPFNNDFFFIMNVAVGGNWPGNPDATTVFPQRMFVDYIRVFQ